MPIVRLPILSPAAPATVAPAKVAPATIAPATITPATIAPATIAPATIATDGRFQHTNVRSIDDARAELAEPELMQIGDLARESGKTVRAIHLYEELDLLQPAARSKGRFRLYAREALVRIRWIVKLQEMGFSLSDIQTVVREWERQSSASGSMVKMRDVYKTKLIETREHMRRLKELEHELEASLHYLDTCDVCDPARLLSACSGCDLHECDTTVPELVAGFRAK